MVVAAALVVAIAAGWAWLWLPLNADITRLTRDVPRAQAILATAREQAEAIVALERTPSNPKGSDLRSAVERVLAERKLRAALGALDMQDGDARLSFPAIRFDDLVGVLDVLARNDALRAVAVTLTGRVEPGMVRAELTLSR